MLASIAERGIEQPSVREIELLAHGYFRGPASLRQAIDQGNWKWSLEQMQAVPEWGSFLHNRHLTSALIDRLTENCHTINMKNCQSLRGKLDE